MHHTHMIRVHGNGYDVHCKYCINTTGTYVYDEHVKCNYFLADWTRKYMCTVYTTYIHKMSCNLHTLKFIVAFN